MPNEPLDNETTCGITIQRLYKHVSCAFKSFLQPAQSSETSAILSAAFHISPSDRTVQEMQITGFSSQHEKPTGLCHILLPSIITSAKDVHLQPAFVCLSVSKII